MGRIQHGVAEHIPKAKGYAGDGPADSTPPKHHDPRIYQQDGKRFDTDV
jgi:hypothetical protein